MEAHTAMPRKTPKQRAIRCFELFTQLPFIALAGFIFAVAAAALAPNGIAVVTRLTESGAIPLPGGLVGVSIDALNALTAITLSLATTAIVLSFHSRDDLRVLRDKSRPIWALGRYIEVLWSVPFSRALATAIFVIHIIHLVLLVAYGGITAIMFLFNGILCPKLDELQGVFKLASDEYKATTPDGEFLLDVPENPARVLCNLSAAGSMPLANLVAAEVLFGLSTACLMMSLGGTMANTIMSERERAELKKVRRDSINALNMTALGAAPLKALPQK